MTTIATHMTIIRTAAEQQRIAKRLLKQVPAETVYDRGNRVELNAWIEVIGREFKLSQRRFNALRRTLKRDLVAELRKVAEQQIIEVNETLLRRADQIKALQGAIVHEQRTRSSIELSNDLQKKKYAFIGADEGADAKLRQFRAINILVNSGAATRNDVKMLGINL